MCRRRSMVDTWWSLLCRRQNTSDLFLHLKKKEVDIFITFWKGCTKPEIARRALDLTFAVRCNRQSWRNLHSAFTWSKFRLWQSKRTYLKAYELVPKAYRHQFRDWREEPDRTHVKFAKIQEQLFDRWCSSKKVGSDHHAKLRQLMFVEEFKLCINSDVRAFLNEKEVEKLDLAARVAVDYSLTHKASFVKTPFPRIQIKIYTSIKTIFPSVKTIFP